MDQRDTEFNPVIQLPPKPNAAQQNKNKDQKKNNLNNNESKIESPTKNNNDLNLKSNVINYVQYQSIYKNNN